jgi:hypothetical protein
MMKRRDLSNVLNGHAEILIAEGSDQDGEATNILLTRYPESTAELAPLFKLASDVKTALTPVAVPAFRSQLRQELEAYRPADIVIGPSINRRKQKWFFVAAAGSALSAMSIILVLLRRLRVSRGDSGHRVQTIT